MCCDSICYVRLRGRSELISGIIPRSALCLNGWRFCCLSVPRDAVGIARWNLRVGDVGASSAKCIAHQHAVPTIPAGES
jgi:hypothetical protein